MHKEKYLEVFQKLNIDQQNISEKTIYEYAPVFVFDDGIKKAVIKRTKDSSEGAQALFRWTDTLADMKINVVTPDRRFTCGLAEFNDNYWVIYPFIEGTKFNSSRAEIFAAGRLLGRIHGCQPQTDFGFKVFSMKDYYDADFCNETDSDFSDLEQLLAADSTCCAQIEKWRKKAQEFFSQKWSQLSSMMLPYCNGVWDYKANNLIYQGENNPVLIDPDNAGRIHRLFDLALTLLLFHNEHEEAPSRLFSTEEWQLFLAGYSESVELTEQEKSVWQDYLQMVFYDEAVWLIKNDLVTVKDDPDKISLRQKKFIQELLCFEPGAYKV